MPTIRQLEYLVALDEEKHFARAAERCHVSQPTLSMQLLSLEERLGAKLIERRKKETLLTPLGAQVLTKAQAILQNRDEIRQLCKSAEKPMATPIVLGAIPTIAPYYMPQLLPQIQKEFPELKLYLKEEQTAVLLESLHKGLVDVALLALPTGDKRLAEAFVFDEPFVVALPGSHALLNKKVLTVEDVTATNLMLLEEGHCLRDQALDVCHMTTAQGDVDFKASSLETLKQMVAQGLGVTLLPQKAVRKGDGYAVREFASGNPHRRIGLVWRKSNPRTKEFKLLADTVKNILSTS